MLFFGIICAAMIGVSAQRCGDTRKMSCKQGCPETNGQRWRTYRKTNHGCCHPWYSCGGTMKHCRFDCDKCSCPAGYRVKDPNQVTSTRRGSVQRTNECCHKQCSSSDCTGDWKPKTRVTWCEGPTCPKNTGMCCTYTGNRLAPGETIEIVKSGDCESNGFEYIKNLEDCKVAGRIVGKSHEDHLNSPFTGGAKQKYCGTWNGHKLSFNSQPSGHLPVNYMFWYWQPVLQHAGRDVNGAEAEYFQLCKGKITTPLRCGSHACAYYYTGITGRYVHNLLGHSTFKLGKMTSMEELSSGLQTREEYGDNYGVFVEAWINAPHTGNYRFKTRSDDSSVVYASVLPDTKNGEMIKMVELVGCCKRVTGTEQVYWEAGKRYYVYGYMMEGVAQDYFEIGFQNVRQDLDIVPPAYLTGGGCTTIKIKDVYLVDSKTRKITDDAQIGSQMNLESNNCHGGTDTTLTVEAGSTTTIGTTFENTYTEDWSRVWGVHASVGATVTTEFEAGWLVSAWAGGSASVSLETEVGAHSTWTDSWSDATTNGYSETEETYASVTKVFTVPAETRKEVVIVGTKHSFEVEWRGQAVCLNDKDEQVGISKEVGGVYESYGYTGIKYRIADPSCDGNRYCQPDIPMLAADIHVKDPDHLAMSDYFKEPLRAACDEANGGVNCKELPTDCRDGQELQAQWVYSKWFIQKCSGDYDVNNPCVCKFPTQAGDRFVPTASIQWVNENPGVNICTYGLPGSLGYDKIPDQDKPKERSFSSLAMIESDRVLDEAFGRRRSPEVTAESDLSTRLVTLEEEVANI